MRQIITLCLAGMLIVISTSAQQLTNTFYFEKGSKHLAKEEKVKLKQWIDSLSGGNISNISIKSYCDADGSNDFNLNLAKARNSELTNLLPSDYKPLITQSTSFGEIGKDEEHENVKSKNRKVVISMEMHSDKIVNENQDLGALWEELKPKSQTFCIDPTRDTILILEGGSIISLSKNSFEQNEIPITVFDDCILLTIDEVLSKKHSYLNSIVTQSNKSTIESAGMVNITAQYKKKTANFIKDKSMMVMLPTQKSSVGNYQMFTGDRDPHSNEMNWLVNNTPALSNISLDDFFRCGNDFDNGGNTNCKFFFCKIKRFFRPKKYKSGKSSYQPKSEIAGAVDVCGNIRELFEKYGVDNYADLQYKMNEALMLKYDVDNMTDLKKAMKNERIQNTANKFANGDANFDDLRFMVYNTNDLGWANCDAFSDVMAINKTQLGVGMDDMKNVDVKLVFKDRNIILSPTLIGDKFYFENVPKHEKVIILAVKMQNNQPQLFMEERIIGKKDVHADFENVTIAQLKNKLTVLDI